MCDPRLGLPAKSKWLPTVFEIKEACDAVAKPDLSRHELDQIRRDYLNDFGLGDEAHPCDLKSSTTPAGRVRSGYVPSPLQRIGDSSAGVSPAGSGGVPPPDPFATLNEALGPMETVGARSHSERK